MDLNFWIFKKITNFLTNIFIYGRLSSIIEQNVGLAAVLIAVIAIALSLPRMVKKLIPAQGNAPVRESIAGMIVKLFTWMFIAVLLFAILAEVKELKAMVVF